jgi:hypothetical protein
MGMSYDTPIFSGEIDMSSQEYTLKEIKNVTTQSVISKQQLQSLHRYLSRQKGEESVIITINDQIPLMLNQLETEQLLHEINQIIKQL